MAKKLPKFGVNVYHKRTPKNDLVDTQKNLTKVFLEKLYKTIINWTRYVKGEELNEAEIRDIFRIHGIQNYR